MERSPREITQILLEWSNGRQEVLHELMPLVYDELRRLAAHYLRRERPDHTLQPTALVHEAYLRLVDQTQVRWQNRAHFFGIAANLMRQILVNHALNRQAAKRGGTAFRLTLDEAAADLQSGRNEPLLPGFLVTGYDLSADGQKVAMSTAERDGKQKLWVAQTDRRSAPRQIPGVEGGQEPLFGTAGEIFFRALEGASGFACRVREDGTGLRKVTTYPVDLLQGRSSDARWLVVFSQAPGEEETIVLLAHPVDGGPPVRISAYDLRVKWSPDGRLIFISWGRSGMGAMSMGRTYVVPLPPGRMFPEIPAAGFRSEDELARLPGVQIIEAADVAPGATPEVYAYSRETVHRNLYRIPLP